LKPVNINLVLRLRLRAIQHKPSAAFKNKNLKVYGGKKSIQNILRNAFKKEKEEIGQEES